MCPSATSQSYLIRLHCPNRQDVHFRQGILSAGKRKKKLKLPISWRKFIKLTVKIKNKISIPNRRSALEKPYMAWRVH